jgi:uncharacterized protein
MPVATVPMEEIEKEITWIEEQYGIDVLLAVEYGSRAWGLERPGSDHDIRIIYRDPPEVAFSLFQERELIQHAAQFDVEDRKVDVDLVGWSLSKALKLGVVSNPQLNEFLNSPKIYRQEPGFHSDLKGICAAASPRVMAHYYRGSGTKNLMSRCVNRIGIDVKAHVQMARGFLSSVWLVQNPQLGGFPPVNYDALLNEVDLAARGPMHASIRRDLIDIAEHKRSGEPVGQKLFTMLTQWGLREKEALKDDIAKIPEIYVDPDVAEKAFRRQYPETFLMSEEPEPVVDL